VTLSRIAAIAAGLGVTLTLNSAQAAFVLTLDDLSTGGIDVTVTDDGAGDSYPGLGTMTFLGPVGSFNVNVTTGVSKPQLTGGVMDLNSINISGGAGGTLVIGLTDTGFTGSFPAYTANYGGTTTGTVDFDFWHDPNDAQFGGGTILPAAPISVGPGAFSGSSTNPIAPGTPYSLSIFATINHGEGSQNTSFDAELRPVPIPPAVWLFGSGLLGLAGVARRRRA